MRLLDHLALALLLLVQVPAQTTQSAGASDATLTYHYERPGLPVPIYTFTIHRDGSGVYVATYLPAPAKSREPAVLASSDPLPAPTTTPITLTGLTTTKLFEHVRSTNLLRGGCASKAKNVASTGDKTLEYVGPDGQASCKFNYTESKPIAAVAETFEGIANTLDTGRKLDFDHRFDRLGLDEKMTRLVTASQEGRALELQTIAPILRSIADDAQVIERVRIRASKLLAIGDATQ